MLHPSHLLPPIKHLELAWLRVTTCTKSKLKGKMEASCTTHHRLQERITKMTKYHHQWTLLRLCSQAEQAKIYYTLIFAIILYIQTCVQVNGFQDKIQCPNHCSSIPSEGKGLLRKTGHDKSTSDMWEF